MRVSQLGQQLFAGCAGLGDLDVEVIVTTVDSATLQKTTLGTYTSILNVGGTEGNTKLRLEVQP